MSTDVSGHGSKRLRSALLALAALAFLVSMSTPAGAGSVVEADDSSYQKVVVGSNIPVILEFSATWCGACKKSAPMIEQMATELAGKVKVVKMDVDRSESTTSRYKVNSIPAFFYLEDGKVKGQAVGALPKESLLRMLKVPEEYWKK